MILINPSTVMIMTTSNLPASIIWCLSLTLKDGEQLQAKASDLISRKNIEYLVVELSGNIRELRLDKIASFSHPEIGTVVVSES
jgi:Rho-binding antiterminator